MKKRVVIVDDDNKIIVLIEKTLLQMDLEVFSAENGTRALELVKEYAPDLLISDLLLPGIDGAELCQKVKGDPDLDHTKVILITGVYPESTIKLELKTKPDGFLPKPIDVKELTKMVKKNL
ncbi:MAG: response regulator [bacterium]|nr:response regulator [bacterium]